MGPDLVKDNPESVMIEVCSGEAWGRGARKGSGFQQHLSLQGSVEGSQRMEEERERERKGKRERDRERDRYGVVGRERTFLT